MLITYPRIETSDARYAYAVGRIRALENKLLPFSKVARLIEARSGEEVLEKLQDTDYSSILPETPQDYENIIKKARMKLFKLIDELIIDKYIIELLRLKYDYYNAKALLKGSIGEKDVDNLLVDFGNLRKEELKTIFQEERYDKLPYSLAPAVSQAISVYYTSKDPRFLEVILDKFYYSYFLQRAKSIFLETLIKIEIDLVNIKSFLRAKVLKESSSFFSKIFIPGSWLEVSRFISFFDEPFEAITRYLEYTPYAKIWAEGIEFLQSKGSFLRLEKLCDKHFVEFLRKTKFLSLGVEPVVAYFYAKENEFKILRMVFVGKLNQIPDELIKERLPDAY